MIIKVRQGVPRLSSILCDQELAKHGVNVLGREGLGTFGVAKIDGLAKLRRNPLLPILAPCSEEDFFLRSLASFSLLDAEPRFPLQGS